MVFYYLMLYLVFLYAPQLFSQSNQNDSILIEKIIARTLKKVKAIKSIEYDIETKWCAMGASDTLFRNAHCYVDNQVNDSIFQQYFYIDFGKVSYLYNGGTAYEKMDSVYEVISYSGENLQTIFYKTYFLDEWLTFKSIQQAFFHRATLNGNKIHKKYLGIQKINNQKCHVINYFYTYPGEDFHLSMTIYITSKSNLPIKSIITFKELDLTEYSEKTFRTYKINKKKSYFENFFSSAEKITPFQDSDAYLKSIEQSTLNAKSNELQPAYPRLDSLITFENKILDTNDLKGKIILIDFWYIGCPPCLKAIPILKKIQEQYTEKELVILGINPMDSERKALLGGFIAKNNISYPIILGDGQVARDFHVVGYPTFFILDKEGIIQFQQEGYTEELKEVLIKKIDGLLGKE